jgi:hypothetical protein
VHICRCFLLNEADHIKADAPCYPEPTPQNYREEAARLRYQATKMTHRENRQQLLDIAALYDWLAKVMERLLQSN